MNQNQHDLLAAENNRIQSQHDVLFVEKQQLEFLLKNLSENIKQLQQSYRSLTAERDELRSILRSETNKRDQLLANYSCLKTECDQLKKSYEVLQRTFNDLQSDYNNLTAVIGQVNSKYKDLQREKEGLQTLFSLEAKRDQSESNCSSLRIEKDQLQESFDMLNKSKVQIETNYSLLWRKKELLQANYNHLTKEKEDLQARCKNLTNSTDLLKMNDKMTEKPTELPCPAHWRLFETKCYFASTVKKSWTESRTACIAEGADLLIINSHEEQEFVGGIVNSGQDAWIGLTDSLTEGVWMWVDGTPVNTTYWLTGQPNSYKGEQDCGELTPQTTKTKLKVLERVKQQQDGLRFKTVEAPLTNDTADDLSTGGREAREGLYAFGWSISWWCCDLRCYTPQTTKTKLKVLERVKQQQDGLRFKTVEAPVINLIT
ncbi:CD209 antigen-like [Poecilia formosa]|uniref:CD209 antigen-like n=1 Tax=Poecilia formosa TaxID=48698 RepID=UPI0007BA999A|nr:PREDICTED: CD209 antigen-like [Poecilia formosa]